MNSSNSCSDTSIRGGAEPAQWPSTLWMPSTEQHAGDLQPSASDEDDHDSLMFGPEDEADDRGDPPEPVEDDESDREDF